MLMATVLVAAGALSLGSSGETDDEAVDCHDAINVSGAFAGHCLPSAFL